MNVSITHCPDHLILRMPKLSDYEGLAKLLACDRVIHERGRQTGDYIGEVGIPDDLRALA